MTLTSDEIRSYDPIRRALQALEGVLDVRANYYDGQVTVESDPAVVSTEELSHAIRSVGYKGVVLETPLSSRY